MITLTFGAGGTYANLIAAIAGAALPVSPAPLPDDYTFLQVGDSTENATVLFSNIENNKKIYVTTDTPHNMNPNVGHLMSLSPGANYGWWILAGDIYVLFLLCRFPHPYPIFLDFNFYFFHIFINLLFYFS